MPLRIKKRSDYKKHRVVIRINDNKYVDLSLEDIRRYNEIEGTEILNFYFHGVKPCPKQKIRASVG